MTATIKRKLGEKDFCAFIIEYAVMIVTRWSGVRSAVSRWRYVGFPP